MLARCGAKRKRAATVLPSGIWSIVLSFLFGWKECQKKRLVCKSANAGWFHCGTHTDLKYVVHAYCDHPMDTMISNSPESIRKKVDTVMLGRDPQNASMPNAIRFVCATRFIFYRHNHTPSLEKWVCANTLRELDMCDVPNCVVRIPCRLPMLKSLIIVHSACDIPSLREVCPTLQKLRICGRAGFSCHVGVDMDLDLLDTNLLPLKPLAESAIRIKTLYHSGLLSSENTPIPSCNGLQIETLRLGMRPHGLWARPDHFKQVWNAGYRPKLVELYLEHLESIAEVCGFLLLFLAFDMDEEIERPTIHIYVHNLSAHFEWQFMLDERATRQMRNFCSNLLLDTSHFHPLNGWTFHKIHPFIAKHTEQPLTILIHSSLHILPILWETVSSNWPC